MQTQTQAVRTREPRKEAGTLATPIVGERLGHAVVTVTAQIYTHRTIGNDTQARRSVRGP